LLEDKLIMLEADDFELELHGETLKIRFECQQCYSPIEISTEIESHDLFVGSSDNRKLLSECDSCSLYY